MKSDWDMYSLPGRDGELDTIANQVVEYLLQSVFILVKWSRIGIYLIKEHLRLFISQRTEKTTLVSVLKSTVLQLRVISLFLSREKSSTSFIRLSSLLPLTIIVAIFPVASSETLLPISVCKLSAMPLSGVCSSWVVLARNSSLSLSIRCSAIFFLPSSLESCLTSLDASENA